jgi:AbrB family looped-hinge helix DNA binding protein
MSKGQVIIPARIRRRYGIKAGTRVHFIERNGEILIRPVTSATIRSLCGILKSDSSVTADLLAERARDCDRDLTKSRSQ